MTLTAPENGKGRLRRTGRKFKRPAPLPYPKAVMQYRDAMTGRYAKAPVTHDAGPGNRPRVRLRVKPQASASDFVVMRTRVDYDDGSSEIINVRVASGIMREARRKGEVSASELREFEQELGREILSQLNPARALEYELEQMHLAHRSDKAKRGAVSRKRNAEARAKDEANGFLPRRNKGRK